MKLKDDEMIIKRRKYINLLMENAKLREQASPFHKYSINEIREILGFSKIELEEKKIPEELDISNFPKHNNSLKKTAIKLNQVIDYLKSIGE